MILDLCRLIKKVLYICRNKTIMTIKKEIKEIKEYYEGTDILKFERVEFLCGFWEESTYNEDGNKLTYKNSDSYSSERTYDENGKILTFKNSSGTYLIKGKRATKEEFEAFTNQEPLTANQKAQAYIYLFGEYEVFFRVEEMIKGLTNNVKYKHLLEVQKEIMNILNLDSCGDKIK